MPILKNPILFSFLVLLSACGGNRGNTDEPSITMSNTITNNTPTDTSSQDNTPNPEMELPVTYALRTGDATQITKEQLFTAINENAALAKENRLQSLNTLFNLNADGTLKPDSITAIDWDPSHDSVWFESTRIGENFPFLLSNISFKNPDVQSKNLAMAGIKPNGARYITMGANALSYLSKLSKPLDTGSQNFQNLMENSIDWLTQEADFKNFSSNIVIAHQSESYWFDHDNSTHQWVTDSYANASVNTIDACESQALESCLENADLLVIGRDNGSDDTHNIEFDLDSVMQSVKKAQEQGIPILYLQYDGGMNDLSSELMTFFGLQTTDNYWRQEGLSNYTHDSKTSKDDSFDAVTTSINHLMNGNINLNFTTENCPSDVCDTSTVIDNNSDLSMEELLNGANILKDLINGFNTNNINVFDSDDESKVIKLSILLADKFRQEVSYPMDKHTTDSNQFMRSLFADSIDYIARDINPAQADMGNFSSSDFSHITPINKTITIESKESFRAAGVYALPGQTVK